VRPTGFVDEERWDGEGGHVAAHIRRSHVIDELAGAGEAQRADLWAAAVHEFGVAVGLRSWATGQDPTMPHGLPEAVYEAIDGPVIDGQRVGGSSLNCQWGTTRPRMSACLLTPGAHPPDVGVR
jgi:hypothetical protein